MGNRRPLNENDSKAEELLGQGPPQGGGLSDLLSPEEWAQAKAEAGVATQEAGLGERIWEGVKSAGKRYGGALWEMGPIGGAMARNKRMGEYRQQGLSPWQQLKKELEFTAKRPVGIAERVANDVLLGHYPEGVAAVSKGLDKVVPGSYPDSFETIRDRKLKQMTEFAEEDPVGGALGDIGGMASNFHMWNKILGHFAPKGWAGRGKFGWRMAVPEMLQGAATNPSQFLGEPQQEGAPFDPQLGARTKQAFLGGLLGYMGGNALYPFKADTADDAFRKMARYSERASNVAAAEVVQPKKRAVDKWFDQKEKVDLETGEEYVTRMEDIGKTLKETGVVPTGVRLPVNWETALERINEKLPAYAAEVERLLDEYPKVLEGLSLDQKLELIPKLYQAGYSPKRAAEAIMGKLGTRYGYNLPENAGEAAAVDRYLMRHATTRGSDFNKPPPKLGFTLKDPPPPRELNPRVPPVDSVITDPRALVQAKRQKYRSLKDRHFTAKNADIPLQNEMDLEIARGMKRSSEDLVDVADEVSGGQLGDLRKANRTEGNLIEAERAAIETQKRDSANTKYSLLDHLVAGSMGVPIGLLAPEMWQRKTNNNGPGSWEDNLLGRVAAGFFGAMALNKLRRNYGASARSMSWGLASTLTKKVAPFSRAIIDKLPPDLARPLLDAAKRSPEAFMTAFMIQLTRPRFVEALQGIDMEELQNPAEQNIQGLDAAREQFLERMRGME